MKQLKKQLDYLIPTIHTHTHTNGTLPPSATCLFPVLSFSQEVGGARKSQKRKKKGGEVEAETRKREREERVCFHTPLTRSRCRQ